MKPFAPVILFVLFINLIFSLKIHAVKLDDKLTYKSDLYKVYQYQHKRRAQLQHGYGYYSGLLWDYVVCHP